MRNPRDFFNAPLAIGAPEPDSPRSPSSPSRMIHFLDFSNEKMVAKVPEIAPKVDILLGNLEDAVSVDRKEAARAGLIKVGREMDMGETALWTRVNELASPWVLVDDLAQLVGGDRRPAPRWSSPIPKVEGAWDIHYVDRLLAQLEAKAGLDRPILIHAILETAQGVANLEEIACASPRIQGMSFGPADLAASRRMKTTRVRRRLHPGYRTIADPDPDDPDAPRAEVRYQRRTPGTGLDRALHGRRLQSAVGALPFYVALRRHQGHARGLRDAVPRGLPARVASARGRCIPAQIEIAKRVFLPDPRRRLRSQAKKVLEAIPDGRGVHMIDGKDAGRRHLEAKCKVMVSLAEMLARKDRSWRRPGRGL